MNLDFCQMNQAGASRHTGRAEHTASLGFDTTAFDVSPSAIAGVRARYPGSSVHYQTADLPADLPADWRGGTAHHGHPPAPT